MKKTFAAFAALSALFASLFTANQTRAVASTRYGCLDGYVCIYKDINWTGGMSAYPAGTIEFAPNNCWVFNSAWNNQMSSYGLNFASSSGEYVTFWDNTNCTGSSFSEPNPPQFWAKMPSGWNDRVGSISVRKP